LVLAVTDSREVTFVVISFQAEDKSPAPEKLILLSEETLLSLHLLQQKIHFLGEVFRHNWLTKSPKKVLVVVCTQQNIQASFHQPNC
jgi:hypothetical protein